MARKRYLIIGDGAAGVTAAQTLRSLDAAARIAIVSDDPHPGYFRAALTNYLLGELREDQLWAVPPDFYQRARVERVYCRVAAVDTARARVWETGGGTPIPYDALLVASGARPRAAHFPGAHLRGVQTMRTIVDVREIAELLAHGTVRSAVVLGGGPLGLEWAHGLHERGVKVHLLERSPRLMGNVLDAVCSDLLAARLKSAGIEVHLGEYVVHAYPGQQGGVGAITTQTGRAIQCELVAVAFGVEPNSEFLQGSGVALDERGRVQTDRSLRTNVANVWAAGDVASVPGESYGLWEPAKRQANVAARNMLGQSHGLPVTPHYLATRLFDLDFATVGNVQPPDAAEVLLDFPQGTGSISYRKFVLSGGRLLGAQMLGERSTHVRKNGRALGRLIAHGADISSIKAKLLAEDFDVSGWLETQKLFARPAPAQRARTLVNLAKLKGTQVLDLGKVKQPSPPSGSGQTAVVAPRQTRMLSIGLQAEAPPPEVSQMPLDARLEYQGRQWPISAAVTRIGSVPAAEFRLPDIGQLHAEITRHGRQMYLRDVGSRSGTLVNGNLLTLPHALLDGDQIQIENHTLVFRSSELVRTAGETRALHSSLVLSVLSGKSLGLSFALAERPVLIGSGARADLRLTEPSVAPEHARITPHHGHYSVADLGSPAGTRLGGAPLSPHQNVALTESALLKVGAVDIRFGLRAQAATTLFEMSARLLVDQGRERGRSFPVAMRCLVGSDPNSDVVLSGIMPQHLEIQKRETEFWVRDITGQSRSFRSGTPLSGSFAPLRSGDVLLLGADVMLRFEEDP